MRLQVISGCITFSIHQLSQFIHMYLDFNFGVSGGFDDDPLAFFSNTNTLPPPSKSSYALNLHLPTSEINFGSSSHDKSTARLGLSGFESTWNRDSNPVSLKSSPAPSARQLPGIINSNLNSGRSGMNAAQRKAHSARMEEINLVRQLQSD